MAEVFPGSYADVMIGAAVMWFFLVILSAAPLWFCWYAWDTARRRRRGEAVSRPSGSSFGFDEVWRPSAAEAQAVWEAEQITPAPAPIPGDGPGVIADGRIVIETGLRPPRATTADQRRSLEG